MMSEQLFGSLNGWVDKHYRDRLSPEDLGDPQLLLECRTGCISGAPLNLFFYLPFECFIRKSWEKSWKIGPLFKSP